MSAFHSLRTRTLGVPGASTGCALTGAKGGSRTRRGATASGVRVCVPSDMATLAADIPALRILPMQTPLGVREGRGAGAPAAIGVAKAKHRRDTQMTGEPRADGSGSARFKCGKDVIELVEPVRAFARSALATTCSKRFVPRPSRVGGFTGGQPDSCHLMTSRPYAGCGLARVIARVTESLAFLGQRASGWRASKAQYDR